MSNLSNNRFFSHADRSRARRWTPDALGNGFVDAALDSGEPHEAAAARAAAIAGEEGFRAGFASGEAAVRSATVRLAKIAASAEHCLAGHEQQIAEGLLDLALDIARQIVRADLKVKRDDVLKVVREAMDCLPQSTVRAQLYLHPNDADLVRSHIGDELASGSWQIVEDHRIEPGGCRISAASCDVDATLATRWKRVVGTLGRDLSWIDNAG